MRSITATVDLDASPDRVWDVLTDTAGHATWNPFITRVSGTLAVGEKIHVRIAPPGGKQMSFRPTVTDFEPGHRLAWLGHLGIPGLFDGAHSFTLLPMSDGHTRLIQHEDFTGVLVWVSRGLLHKTAAGFEAMHRALINRISETPPSAGPRPRG